METPTYVGLDIHKNTIVANALDPQGRRVDQNTLGSADAELVRYLSGLPGEKRVVMEAWTFCEHV